MVRLGFVPKHNTPRSRQQMRSTYEHTGQQCSAPRVMAAAESLASCRFSADGGFAGSRPGGRVAFFDAKKATKETCPAPSRALRGALRCSFRPGLFRQHILVQSEKASASMPRPFTSFRAVNPDSFPLLGSSNGLCGQNQNSSRRRIFVKRKISNLGLYSAVSDCVRLRFANRTYDG